MWTKEEKEEHHINELELIAVEIALKTFLKERNLKLVHIYMDNMTALHYLIRKGGTKSVALASIAKRICEFLQRQGTTITASWIPSKENGIANWRPRQKANSSEWEFSGKIFEKNSKHLEKARSGLLCLKNNKKAAKIYVTKSRSELFGNKCSVPRLGELPIPVHTFLPNGQGIAINSNRPKPEMAIKYYCSCL